MQNPEVLGYNQNVGISVNILWEIWAATDL